VNIDSVGNVSSDDENLNPGKVKFVVVASKLPEPEGNGLSPF